MTEKKMRKMYDFEGKAGLGLEDIRKELERALKSGELDLPEGVNPDEVSVEWAPPPSDAYVHPDVVTDFLEEICECRLKQLDFVSEDSSVLDFIAPGKSITPEMVIERIQDYYDVDVSDILDLNFWKVLRRIDGSE